MARPHKCRFVTERPCVEGFQPRGRAGSDDESIVLRFDELEALRLGDLEGLYHAEAAEEMGVSRATFGRIVAGARQKVAAALVHGKPIVIDGGEVEMIRERTFECGGCHSSFSVPCGQGRPMACPTCQSPNIRRSAAERGHGCHGNRGKEAHGHGRGQCATGKVVETHAGGQGHRNAGGLGGKEENHRGGRCCGKAGGGGRKAGGCATKG